MTHSSDCLFCALVAGTIPSHRVYEDDETIAFLDIHPVHSGHVLVIPKIHATDVRDSSEASLMAVMRTVKRMAIALTSSLSVEGINVMHNAGHDAGQIIPHLHMHLIPRWPNDGLIHWPGGSYGEGEAAAMAEKIRGAIQLQVRTVR